MKSEFLLAFNQICSERGLPPEVVLDALKTALVSAYRRNTNISSAQNVTVEIDQNSGQAAIYVEKEAVEEVRNHDTEVSIKVASNYDPDVKLNDTVMVESTPDDFGRIAAQTAKQVILQRIREAEREALYEDYIGREGEIINGVVQSVTNQHVSLNLGRTEAILPRREQVPSERYTLHQRLRAYVVEVKRSGRGPQIIVSRSHKNMLRRLLELEVPEIYNGAVEIKSIAREAGARSKVAVAAKQPGVDPVGSCVGMRGVRIQSIVNELGGEKIDVIEWDPDPAASIAKALSPARVLTVHLEENPTIGHTATVIVPDDQLSLAIGREGQNARLAAKLTGWRIDIKSVTEAAREAVVKAEDPKVHSALGPLAELVPTVDSIVQSRDESRTGYTTEQLLLLRQLVDGVHSYFAAQRRAERMAMLDKEASRRTAIAAEEAERRAEREKALAEVPDAAFEMGLDELELSTRVFNHLDKAKIQNLGQIMELLVDGDEGLLALDGIGPKALAEIKERVEATAPDQPEETEVSAEAVEEAPAEAEEPVETEQETVAEGEPEPLPEEELAEEIAAPESSAEAEIEVEKAPAIEPEPEPAEEPTEAPAIPERDLPFEHIPADAYDIPLPVLALSGKVLGQLRKAKIDNLGQIMELLLEGDETLLALEGIDTKALAEIKTQVEIMVSVPSEDDKVEEPAESEEETEGRRFPRYEYVADDEMDRWNEPQRQKRRKQRPARFETETDEAPRRRGRRSRIEDWDNYEE